MVKSKRSRRLRPRSVDQLPADPLRMPPPYWRSGGAIFQLEDGLQSLLELLRGLPELNGRTTQALDAHYQKYPRRRDSESDEAMEEFVTICDALWSLEHKITLKAQLVILMMAIQAEELINQFCVFNLPRELAETLERLSPAEKLTAAASALGRRRVRAESAFGAVTDLMSWRNAFAHGHCVDRPLKSLRHNHLISPEEYPGVPDSIAQMLRLAAGYTRLAEYIRRISKNSYTRGTDLNWREAQKALGQIEHYRFRGDPTAYEVDVRA